MILGRKKTPKARKEKRPRKAAAAAGVATAAASSEPFSRRLVTLWSGSEEQADAIERCAAVVRGQHIDMGRRGLIVAGASSGVGVSFVAANLAVALSQMEISTVLVDANLHHPSIDAYFPHADAEIGLQQHLRSPDVGFADVVQRDILHRLSVVFSGGPAGDASELLLSDRFRSFVEQCLREFECTIIDTPAANRSSDAGLVGSIVGYALLVGRRSVSYIGDLEQLTGELAKDRVEVIGGVLNGA